MPDSAAVNEAVEQAKKSSNVRAGGYVNGVLRAISAKRRPYGPPAGQDLNALSIRYSHPLELVKLLDDQLPKGTLEAVLKADQHIPPTVLRQNSLRPALCPKAR